MLYLFNNCIQPYQLNGHYIKFGTELTKEYPAISLLNPSQYLPSCMNALNEAVLHIFGKNTQNTWLRKVCNHIKGNMNDPLAEELLAK